MIQSDSFYAYVRRKNKSKSKVGPIVNSLNMQMEDEEQTCEILNEYFSSAFRLLSQRLEGLTVLEIDLIIVNKMSSLN